MSTTQSTARRGIADILTLGCGTAVAMWAIGYFTHLPGMRTPSALVFVLLLALLSGGGWLAGRFSGRGITGGVWTGATAALANLLILGSVMRDLASATDGSSGGGSVMAQAPLWALGSIAISAGLGALGAAAGMRSPRPLPAASWSFWFATIAAAATLLLLFAGGLVTSNRAGLAVPDWPSTYGSNMFLYPLSKMTGGIYYEHAHRLLGTLVGLISIALAFYIQRAENRGWVKALAWLTLVAVIVQGVFGGVRVTENAITLAIVHGVLGQGVFAMFVMLAAACSPAWHSSQPQVSSGARSARALTLWLIGIVILQVALGSLVRHIDFSWHLHATVAVVVLVIAAITNIRINASFPDLRLLRKAANGTLHAVGAQFLLGFATLFPHMQVAAQGMLSSPTHSETPHEFPALYIVLATAHQIVGAIIFAWSARLALLTSHFAVQGEDQD